MPKAGTELTITSAHILPPDIREGIVINLSELRLFYFAKNEGVMTFPIGIGQEGWQTPLGKSAVAKKRKNPSWLPPASIREENQSRRG
jgi:L,D-transpeptidase ErfK/SrfK